MASDQESREIVVIGGGGHAKVVISILRKLSRFRTIGYTDLKNNGALLDVPYIGDDSAVARICQESGRLHVVLGVGQVGSGAARSRIAERLEAIPILFPVIVSSTAIVDESVALGDGTVVMDSVVMNAGAVAGKGAIVNTGAIVEHDVVLGDWVHVAPGSVISGGTRIGTRSMIGAGAVVIEGRTIAADCIVGAGAVVVRDIEEAGVYAGCPARRIR